MKTAIDRYRLVTRHNPVIRGLHPRSPQSVGNGEFAFTADLTGLQSFPDRYEVPLGTQSTWGWHSTGGRERYSLKDVRLRYFDTYGRQVGYPVDPLDSETPYHWMRQNPHRLYLGQIGLELRSENGTIITNPEQLENPEQTLHLWEGLLISRFRLGGVPVEVYTSCHPDCDQLGVRIVSPLIGQGRLDVRIGFPAQSTAKNWVDCIRPSWEADRNDTTSLHRVGQRHVRWDRKWDDDVYQVEMRWSSGELMEDEPHRYRLLPRSGGNELSFTVAFAPAGAEVTLFRSEEIEAASRRHWSRFWNEGGAVELADSSDPRAHELERRIVLSQFLTAIHSAGSIPPQETGLMYNSWFGKPHLEMHWWHAAHFPMWGRSALLEKSMGWYNEILPVARELAASQGYRGARWPKMVGPEGIQSPSPIAPLLIWQQPHPIMLAELLYQVADEKGKVLDQYRNVVLESAEFMASFAVWDASAQRYVLGPPLIPVQENHAPEQTVNPVFELEYWLYGLETAQLWRLRAGLPKSEEWERICHLLARPKVSPEKVYLAHERCPDTFTRFHHDHPSMLMALGVLPGKTVDAEIMRNTLKKVVQQWRWDTAWGWDFPVAAMTAARLGDGKLAVDILLAEQVKNTYLPNGHNYQRPGLFAYLPGNGGLLAAVAMMACGWRGAGHDQAPGFPDDGTWTVRWEGLHRLL